MRLLLAACIILLLLEMYRFYLVIEISVLGVELTTIRNDFMRLQEENQNLESLILEATALHSIKENAKKQGINKEAPIYYIYSPE